MSESGSSSVGGPVDLRLSEVLAGLSHALDITEGQTRGHAERSQSGWQREMAGAGFEPANSERANLQSAAFDHFATPPRRSSLA